ncbi:MAG TPA: hypothetical protein VF577_03180 [Allosphingosinicella sp.]|jgi:hypothetical protein
MIVEMLLSLAALQGASTPAAEGEELAEAITVIGQRARRVRWDWRVNRAGRLTKCKITRSSGDSEIDQIGCEATRQCAASGLRRERQMRACIIPLREQLIRALAERRGMGR